MGVPTYIFPNPLLPLWWKPLVLMGYFVQRKEERQWFGSSHIDYDGGIIRSGTEEILLTIMEKGSCAIYSDDNLCLNIDNTHLGVLWYPLLGGRHLVRSVERTLLSSGVTAASKPLGCRLLYLCSPDLAEHWPEYFARRGYKTTVLMSKVVQNDVANIQVVSMNGLIEYTGVHFEVFSGLGINPNTEQYQYYIALDYRRGLMNRLFQSRQKCCNAMAYVDSLLLQQYGAKKLSINVRLHWTRKRGHRE